MPAQKSKPKNQLSPQENARRVFSAEFLKQLGEKFGFDGTKPQIVDSVRNIAEGYFIALNRAQKTNFRKAARREYLQLIKDTDKFRKILENAKADGIDDDMELFAQLHARQEMSGASEYSQFPDTKNTLRKYDALIAHLNLLILTAQQENQNFSTKPGPKIDEALAALVRRAGNFWIFNLGRKFTIDHHKGTGTTKSFEFIKTLSAQLSDIPDTHIVTAMRADKSARRTTKISPKKALQRAK
jgi:hypothetical protein